MTRSELAVQYLQTFASRDVHKIRTLFSNDVVLRDWDQSATGIDAVMEANQGIFDAFSSIDVEIFHCHEGADAVAVEMKITLQNDQESIALLVTDIIGFDQNNLITFVRAYKG